MFASLSIKEVSPLKDAWTVYFSCRCLVIVMIEDGAIYDTSGCQSDFMFRLVQLRRGCA